MLRGFTRFYHSFFMSVRRLSFFCFNIRERLLDKLGACKFLSITEFWSNKQELHKWWLIPEIRSHIPLRISRLHERVTTKTHPDWLALLSAPVVVTVAKYCFLASKKIHERVLAAFDGLSESCWAYVKAYNEAAVLFWAFGVFFFLRVAFCR